VAVRGGLVDTVTTVAAVEHLPAAERIDARGQVAMPGLINCHRHAPMVALRGVAEHMDTVAAVVRECGIRAHLGQAYFSCGRWRW